MSTRKNSGRSLSSETLFALSLSGFVVVFFYPQIFDLAQWLQVDHMQEGYLDSEYLIIPIFLLCMLVCFFGLTVILRFLPQLLLLLLFTRR